MFAFLTPEMTALAISGFLIVFVVLGIISFVVSLFRHLDKLLQKREDAQEEKPQEQTIDDTTLILITAACATAVAGRFKVRRVRRILSPRTHRTPWSSQGRISLLGSHRVDIRR
ncbi:MAG: hypothetical protein CSA62_02735 [Planctomycetota bacterium]|nr:MAG: hypothetical protein CSA62_02735 [Planctomycetota bacterium]